MSKENIQYPSQKKENDLRGNFERENEKRITNRSSSKGKRKKISQNMK